MMGAPELITRKPEPAPRPGRIDWTAAAASQPPPRQWLIDGWLGVGTPTLLAGSGGTGKSLLALQLAAAIAGGRAILGAQAAMRDVLLWSCEDDALEVWRRLTPIAQHLDVDLKRLDIRLHAVDRSTADSVLVARDFGAHKVRAPLQELAADIEAYAPTLVILDNVSQLHALNSNDTVDVVYFVRSVRALAPADTTFVFLHHTARAAGSEYAGSAAWENACRSRWYLGRQLPDQQDDDRADAEPDVRYLARRKSNYSAIGEHRRLRWTDGVLVDETPEAVASGPPGTVDALYRERAERIVLDGLRRLREMGHLPTCEANSRGAYLPDMLMQFKLGQGDGRKSLEAAMRSLMVAGRLRKAVVGRYSNRSPREGLVIVDDLDPPEECTK